MIHFLRPDIDVIGLPLFAKSNANIDHLILVENLLDSGRQISLLWG